MSAESTWERSGQDYQYWEVDLRALATAYDFKLKAQTYAQAEQLVGELVQQTRLHAASVARADAMLVRMQNWFAVYGSGELLFVPF